MEYHSWWKTCQSSIKQSTQQKGGGKATRWKGPKSCQMKESSKEGWMAMGEKKVQDRRTQVLANEEPSNGGGWWGGGKGTRLKDPSPGKRGFLQRGWIARGTWTNQVSKPACLPSVVKSISDNERGEEHHSSTSRARFKIQNGSDLGRFVQNL